MGALATLRDVAPILAAIGLIFAAPVWCWRVGPGWPHTIRDWGYRTCGWLMVGLAFALFWPIGVFLAITMWRWRDHESTGPVLTWLGAVGAVGLGVFIGPSYTAIAWAVQAVSLSQLGVLVFQVFLIRKEWHNIRHYHDIRDTLRGSFGNRVMTGAWFAMALPLSPHPAFLALNGLGLVATSSMTASAAGAVGLAVAYPQWAPTIALSGAVGFLFNALMRKSVGDLLYRPTRFFTIYMDSFADRYRIWRLTLATWWGWTGKDFWLGKGHGVFFPYTRWWLNKRWVYQLFKHAHNDLVQCTMEYGAVGVLCAILGLLALFSKVNLAGDPLLGAILAMTVVSLNQFPLHTPHTALPWLLIVGLYWSQ